MKLGLSSRAVTRVASPAIASTSPSNEPARNSTRFPRGHQVGYGAAAMTEFEAYENALQPARTRFGENPLFRAMLSEDVDRDLLELFLMHFTALGVGMTEPVDGWIRRAGERCKAIGLDDLGRSLIMHAKHEAGHHLMMIDDTKKLAERWNARHADQVSADALLATPLTPGVRRYRDLHEDVIAGDTPFGQLAIEYEIEMLSIVHGKHLIENCVARLGKDIVHGLSFLEEHVEVDAGHTKFNAAELGRLVSKHPTFVGPLATAGSAALDAYAMFLDDCANLATAFTKRRRA